MMDKSKEILGFIVETKAFFQNKVDDTATSEEEKKTYQYRIEAFSELENWISWRLKSSEEKQIVRLQQLATMRKIDALSEKIKQQEVMIYFYELFQKTHTYICALSTATLDSLKIFCEDQLNKIDFKPRSFIETFPSEIEIKQVFKPYFEITKPAKGNGNMFDECYEKIENLYNELLKLNKTT